MKRIIIIIIALASLSCQEKKYPEEVKMVCMPFRTSTTVPTEEENFDAMTRDGQNLMGSKKVNKIDDSVKIREIVDLLAKITASKTVKLDDYDIRASIDFKGEKDKYYFNWDHKHLIYKTQIYKIPVNDSKKLEDLVDMCKDYRTTPIVP